jgi:FkbM family methyltransferase
MSNYIQDMHKLADTTDITVGEVFEEVVKIAHQNLIQKGDYVVDIGAHHGFHLYPMAQAAGKSGKVFAFEPLPDLNALLKRDIKKLGLKNIKLYDFALGQQKAESNFQYFKKFPAYSGLERRDTPFSAEEGELETITVKQRRLDSLIRFSKVSFMKLDIEGGELYALMGARKLVKRSKPIIIFEGGSQSSANTYHYTKDDFFNFFEELGYSIFTIDGQPFDRVKWENPAPCWEFVALPEEKINLRERFPDFCKEALQTLA